MICFSCQRRSFSNPEISEKIEPLLEEHKRVVHDKLPEGLPPMRDIQHHGASILHGFEDPFMWKEFAKDDIVYRSIDWNSRTSSFEEGGTHVGSQDTTGDQGSTTGHTQFSVDRPVDPQKVKF